MRLIQHNDLLGAIVKIESIHILFIISNFLCVLYLCIGRHLFSFLVKTFTHTHDKTILPPKRLLAFTPI